MATKVLGRRLNRCFYTRTDGTTGVLVHGYVWDLSDGSRVKWNRKSGSWSWESEERWDRAVATSLNARALRVADEKGRMRSMRKEWFAFENFAEWIVSEGGVSVEDFLQMVGGVA